MIIENLKEKLSIYSFPCENGIDWLESLNTNDTDEIIKRGLEEKKYDWLSWGLTRLLSINKLVMYAKYAAKIACSNYYSKYILDISDYYATRSIGYADIVASPNISANCRAASAYYTAYYAVYAISTYIANLYNNDIINSEYTDIINYGYKLLCEGGLSDFCVSLDCGKIL